MATGTKDLAMHTYLLTALGSFIISAEDGYIVRTEFSLGAGDLAKCESPLLNEASKQLSEYLSGNRTDFDLPLRYEGTPFQKAVWGAIRSIPYGEVRTYSDIAEEAGNPLAYRPAASGCAANPIPIFIPCHRVVAKGMKLGGYSFGTQIKRELLKLEGISLNT